MHNSDRNIYAIQQKYRYGEVYMPIFKYLQSHNIDVNVMVKNFDMTQNSFQ